MQICLSLSLITPELISTPKELKILKDYITKYPQIVVRKLKYKQIKTGKIVREVPLETPTEIILDINMTIKNIKITNPYVCQAERMLWL